MRRLALTLLACALLASSAIAQPVDPQIAAETVFSAPAARYLAQAACAGDVARVNSLPAFERGSWLDLGPQLTPERAWPWENLHLLLQSGARLDQTVGNQYNIVEKASMHDASLALQLLQTYDYAGDYAIIAYHAMNGIAMDFPRKQERQALLDFLRDQRGVDLDAIKARYRLASGQENSSP